MNGSVGLVCEIGNYITFVFFIIDIIINFRTTYIANNNDEIVDPKMIAKKYLSSSMFWFDLISTLPISEISDLRGSSGSTAYVKWLKQLKVFRILRLAKLSKFLKSD